MQICFYFPALENKQNNALFLGMYKSFFSELEKLDVEVKFTTKINEIDGDILVTSTGIGLEKNAAKAMFHFHGPVILNVYNANICFYTSFLKRWHSRILFAYCTDYAELNFKKYNSVGIKYKYLPFGSDANIFKPILQEKIYDIAFLGNANSGYGRDKYIEPLVEYAKSNQLNMFLAGGGWDKYGYPYRIVKHGEESNLIYNQSKICINIHNDRQYAGEEIEMDANNRLFDLAMAGCCQVSNGEQMIRHYFDSTEVAGADDPGKWIAAIDYYLKNEPRRTQLGICARKKSLVEHTWEKRAKQFISYINETYPDYRKHTQKVSFLTSVSRQFDKFIPPPYLIKEIRIIRYFLKKLGLHKK